MPTTPSVTLPSGDQLPIVGAGTWNISGDTVKKSVRAALDAGYTHIDTAEGYSNEREIGKVLTEYDRDDIFLTSKVLPKHLDYESVLEAFENSISSLGTDYLDLYLIHWPNPAISLRETLHAMARLQNDGKVRNIGVSNFSTYQLGAAQRVSSVPIAVNQIEFHPLFFREDLLGYCRENDVIVEAAAPLARTEILSDPIVENIAENYDRSPAQIVLKWAVEKNVVVLPKSTSPNHLRQNIQLFDWELSESDMKRIDGIDRAHPVYDDGRMKWADDDYGIAE